MEEKVILKVLDLVVTEDEDGGWDVEIGWGFIGLLFVGFLLLWWLT